MFLILVKENNHLVNKKNLYKEIDQVLYFQLLNKLMKLMKVKIVTKNRIKKFLKISEQAIKVINQLFKKFKIRKYIGVVKLKNL